MSQAFPREFVEKVGTRAKTNEWRGSPPFCCSRSNFRAITRLETLAMQAIKTKTVYFAPATQASRRWTLLCTSLTIPNDGSVMHIANVTFAVCRGKQDVSPRGRRARVLGLIFAGYVPLASQSPYPIIVYFVASYRPHLSHFWANVILAVST